MELNRKIRRLRNAQLRDMTVGDIMAPEVVTINEDASLEQLYSLISEYHHVGYPGVNKEDKVTGVI